MTTVSTLSASKALKERLSNRYARNANVTSGFISTVTNDSTGRAKSATVQLPGGTTISVQVPYGSNIFPGISVSLVNDGSPSLASWRIAGSSSASPVTLGGQIVNQNGSIIANFDSIWVKDRGYIMAGGMEDILGDPTGPRVMMNEYGLFGYAIPFPEPVISIATIESNDLHVGDMLLGYKRPNQANLLISPEQGLIEFDVNDTPFLVINGATGNRLEDYLWIGPSSGPQVGMGKMLGVAEFAMRDIENRYVFLVRSDPMRVQVGATGDPQGFTWESGLLNIVGSLSVGATGQIIWAGGKGVADATGISHTEDALTYWRVKPAANVFMEIVSNGSANYKSLQVEENYGIGGYFKGGYIGVYGKSTTDEIGIMGYSSLATPPPGSPPPTESGGDMTDGIEALNPGVSVYGLTEGGTAGRFVAQNSGAGGRALVAKSDDNTHMALFAWNTGTGPALVTQGSTKLGDGGTTNYTQFDATGHLTFAGTAKPWNDMLIEPSARTTGANAPTFEKWYDDVTNTSRGVYLYSFDDATAGSEKEVFFTLQMSHAWDGGNIQFHVHWIGAVADTTATPRWGLEYVFKEPGAVFGDSTIIYAVGNHLSEADITAHKHYITAFSAIVPGSTANDLSSVLIGRLFRNSSDAADTYNATGAKCGLLYIDAHYQIARIGSTDEYSA